MPRTIYALFVGIDDYLGGVNPLKGCVNDVTRLHDLLAARVTGGSDRFSPLLLTNAQATRQGIIDAWRSHLGQAGSGDVALFCYAGHGSQENAPPEFWDFEPDHLNETLVCHDSRAAGGWDLADKELAQLIAEVAANGPHFAVILDCCHSGSGTRDAEDVTIRQQMADDRTRPIASYIVSPQQVAGLHGQPQSAASPAMPWAAIASGRHILLAACRPEQTAKETVFPGPTGLERRGAFSYYLQDTLQQSGAPLSYRDLFKRVNALVQGRVADQHPQLEASEPADLDQPFLGGAIPAVPATFTLSKDRDLGWIIDAGAIHGIPQPAEGGESTQLAFFPFDADPASLRSMENAAGQASVTQVYPGQSAGDAGARRPCAAGHPDDLQGRGDQHAAAAAQRGLRGRSGRAGLRPPGAGQHQRAGRARPCWCGRATWPRPSTACWPTPRPAATASAGRPRRSVWQWTQTAWTLRAPLVVAHRLEHIARWVSAARLTNPATQLPRDAISLDIFRERADGELELLDTASGVRYEYEQLEDGWRKPRVQIRLRNTTPDQRLFCMLLALTDTYSIYPGLLHRGGVWLDPGQEVWAAEMRRGVLNKTIPVSIPDKLWQQGVTEVYDILKLIVSTDEADATLMQQDELPVTFAPTMRSIPRNLNTLNRLMARVHTRSYGAESGSDDAYVDWTTVEVASTIVRPAEAVDVV